MLFIFNFNAKMSHVLLYFQNSSLIFHPVSVMFLFKLGESVMCACVNGGFWSLDPPEEDLHRDQCSNKDHQKESSKHKAVY